MLDLSPLWEFGLIALGLYAAGWLSGKVGLSSIVGYILLGLLFGPYGVVTLFEVTRVTDLFGELGIILLLFYMGLEFSVARFVEGRRAITVAGTIDLANFVVGFVIGLLLGFGVLAALFLGGIVYISSSGVIARLLTERDLIAYPEAERTLGVLVYEDLAMVVILGGLGIVTAGGGAASFLGVALFLAVYGLLLRFAKPYLERLLDREGETLVLLTLALVVVFSTTAKSLGFPEAVAAFLLGMLLAESRFKDRLEATLHPWYDVAAAAFFLDFGLHVDILSALTQLPAALLLVVATVVTNMLTGFTSGRLSGLSPRASVGHGLMLLPRGEFSLVIAGLAAGVSALPESTREAIIGMTSLYVLTMVILGSLVFRYYDTVNERLANLLKTPAQRAKDRERRQDLESVTLD